MPVGGSGAKLGVSHGDGLALIVDVRVCGHLDTRKVKALESHNLGLILDGTRVEGEGHINSAVGSLRGEGGLSGDGLAVNLKSLLGHVAVVISRLHMEGALEGVLLAGDEVLVGDRIHYGRRVVGNYVLVAVNAIRSGGADFRRNDLELLVGVILVGMLSNKPLRTTAQVVQLLVDRDSLITKAESGDVHLNDLRTGRVLCREGLGSRHRLPIHKDGLASGSIHEGCIETILVALGEATIGHLVCDSNVTHTDLAVSISGVIGVGRDFRLEVVQRTKVVRHAVSGDDNGSLDKGVPLIGRTRQLLNGVAVIGQSAKGVVGLGHTAFGSEAEPDTG